MTEAVSTVPGPGAFFAMLTEAETRALLARAVTRKFAKGQAIFRKGDPGAGLYLVLSGYVAVSIDSACGNDRPLRAYGPGDVIGDISILDGKGRISGAMALEDAVLKFVRRSDFAPLLVARPGLALAVIGYLCARMRRQHDDLDAQLSLDVPGRLARLVLSLDRRLAPPCDGLPKGPLRFSQAQIAALAGLSRKWVGRELADWRDAGLVALGRKRLTILDRAALERIVVAGDSRTDERCGDIRPARRRAPRRRIARPVGAAPRRPTHPPAH
jgi:CRP-like cAMP-binding protein